MISSDQIYNRKPDRTKQYTSAWRAAAPETQNRMEHDTAEYYTALSRAVRMAQRTHRRRRKETAKNEVIEIRAIQIEEMQIAIRGCGDLILNKMNDPTSRQLIDARKDKAKSTEKPNQWECVITSMHWRDGKPTDFSEEGLRRALIENAPCISAFGLKKSIEETIVRCGFDKYSTKFRSGANIIAPGGLIPIRFTEHHIDEKLMSPKRGAPVLARLNRFSGWSATFTIQYIATSYSAEQIVNLVNAAGFGGGIGSGRSSGYGRYEVAEVTVIRRAE